MPQQVVTELVIDSDTSGANQFSQAMDKASDSAQKGTSSAASVSLAIAGVGVAAIGALAGLRAFVDYVGNQSQALVDMADHARLAGISTREFQETLFAARASGLTEKDFVSGLDRLSADLTAASRGATEFGKLFEANGLSIKNANGELKTAKQALGDIATLVQNSSPAVAQGVAKIVGVSAAWIPFLRQGVEGIEAQKKAAADLGVIIDDDMIAKATEFNAQWKTAVATWDLQFKASLASILPLLIQLATIASNIIQGIGSVTGFVSRLTTPDDQKTTAQINAQIDAVARLEDVMTKFGEQSFRANNLKGSLGLPEDADLKTVDAYIEKLHQLNDEKQKLVRIPITGGGTTVLPPTGSDAGRDALQVEIDRLEKHIEVTKADTEAIGQSVGVQAGLRAEATLYQAAIRAGKTDLEKYADQFLTMRERVQESTDTLEKARQKVADIGQATSALSSFSDTLIQGMIKGADATQTLTSALGSLGSSLQSIGTRSLGDSLKSLLSGGPGTLDPTALGLGAVGIGVSIISSIIGGNSKAAQELAEAKKAWDGMATQVGAFSEAARGVQLGPLTNQLRSLSSTVDTLMQAAMKAHDFAGASQLGATFNAGATRLTAEFVNGQDNLTPLQQSMKALRDEAAGLFDTLNSLNLGSLAGQVYPALQNRLAALVAADAAEQASAAAQAAAAKAAADGTEQVTLQLRLLAATTDSSTLQGQLALFDARAKQEYDAAVAAGSAASNLDLLTQALAAERDQVIKNADAVAAQAAATAAATAAAEKLSLQMRLLSATTDSSTLAGALTLFDAKAKQEYDAAVAAGSTNLTLLLQVQAAERQNIIDDFGKKAIDAEKQLADARLAQMQRIQQYLDGLTGGSSSTLSPRDRLDAARSQFETQFKLAQGGDQNALSNITTYSDNFLQASRAYNASSQAFQSDLAFIQSSLASLMGAAGISSTAAASSSTIGSVSGVTTPVAANSNSWAGVVDAVNSLKGEVVILKTTLKASIDTGNQVAAQAHTEEKEDLDQIVSNTGKLVSSSAGPRP